MAGQMVMLKECKNPRGKASLSGHLGTMREN